MGLMRKEFRYQSRTQQCSLAVCYGRMLECSLSLAIQAQGKAYRSDRVADLASRHHVHTFMGRIIAGFFAGELQTGIMGNQEHMEDDMHLVYGSRFPCEHRRLQYDGVANYWMPPLAASESTNEAWAWHSMAWPWIKPGAGPDASPGEDARPSFRRNVLPDQRGKMQMM